MNSVARQALDDILNEDDKRSATNIQRQTQIQQWMTAEETFDNVIFSDKSNGHIPSGSGTTSCLQRNCGL
ncbi:hypothetical protein PHYPO_G00221500 [Pangasianodon hypophthalmus]|uniref:Uncharacterized protein n=1 Tax=Pangasianodon hypophthalmus TaxID=310915 RepID=A0A5N5NUT3_PANHP|nr:hypothetical protein PHYPO_G00221500 [Pangasianodon hypophthalmus]